MKITSNIFQVGGSSHSDEADAAVYLIRAGSEAALVDAGTGRATGEILANISELSVQPREIRYLFITHCHYDHTGGINAIRSATGCAVVAHGLDAGYIEAGDPEVTAASWYREEMEPTPVDIRVSGKEMAFPLGGLEVRFIHAPGHSPGSSVLTVVSDELLVLFGQDVHGPLNDGLLSNRHDYIESLKFLISLEADVLCEGHFGVYKGKKRVREFIESFL